MNLYNFMNISMKWQSGNCWLALWNQKGIQCTPDISRNWIYRGLMLDPIFGAQERNIFLRNRGNSLNPIRPQDNFWWNLLIAIAFVPVRRRQFFAKSTLAYLSNAGWNTCCAMVSHARWSIDTAIVSQSKVQLIHCQCKSRLQIANLDINTAFLIKSLFGHAVYIRHLVQTPR